MRMVDDVCGNYKAHNLKSVGLRHARIHYSHAENKQSGPSLSQVKAKSICMVIYIQPIYIEPTHPTL